MAIREVIFRGKRADNGEWVEGGYIPLDVDSSYEYIVEPCNYASTFSALDKIKLNSILVLPSTVGQYTGLTDKNGRKIFEGDIVKLDNFIYIVDYFEIYARFIAKRINSAFAAFSEIDYRFCEIIGNIHDNPELLEGHDDNA